MNVRSKLAAAALAATTATCAVPEPPVDPELSCRDRLVTVNHAAGYLAAHPEHLEVCAGQTIVIDIRPPVDAGSARTTPAGEREPEWLRARNGERGIEMRVPEDADYRTYKYNITIEGVGTLDPRVTVKRR